MPQLAQQSFHWVPAKSSGNLDGRYPDGNDATGMSWDTLPSMQNIDVGSGFSIDLRPYFNDIGSPSAVFSIYPGYTPATGWYLSGDTWFQTGLAPQSGSIRFRATRLGVTVDTPVLPYSSISTLTSGGTVTPPQVTGLVCTPQNGAVALVWDPSCDPSDGAHISSGLENYDVALGGTVIETIAAPGVGLSLVPQKGPIGSLGTGSATQGADPSPFNWSVSADGLIGGNSDDFYSVGEFSVTGPCLMTAYIASITGGPAGQAGLMVRASQAQNSIFYMAACAAAVTNFDFFIGPSGSDSNPGTQASPWSITSLNTKQSTYAGKAVGVLPGTYNCYSLVQGGSFNQPPLVINGGPNTFVGTGSISGTTLTITGTTSGSLAIGNYLSGGSTTVGAQSAVLPGTRITAGSGTSWTVNKSQTLASTSINGYTPTLIQSTIPRGAILTAANPSGGGYPTNESAILGQGQYGSLPPNPGNCIIDGFYVTRGFQQGIAFYMAGAGIGTGVVEGGVAGVEIRNCEIFDIGGNDSDNVAGIFFQGITGAWVHNNKIHSIQPPTGSQNPDDVACIYVYNSYGCLFEYCTLYDCNNSLFDKSSSTGNHTFRYNYVECMGTSPQNALHGASGGNAGDTTTINNNILKSNANLWDGSGSSTENLLFYNNTCIWASGQTGITFPCASPHTAKQFNNIFVTPSSLSYQGVFCTLSTGTLTSNFNNYGGINSGGTDPFALVVNGTSLTFSAAQGAGYDANSVNVTPTFISTGTATTGGPTGYQLKAGSAGSASGSSPGNTKIDGSGSKCDMGAWGGTDVNTGQPIAQIGCDFASSVGTGMLYRPTTGGACVEVPPSASFTAPCWLQLRRANGVFTASASSDGDAWSVLATLTDSLPQTLIWELATASGSPGNPVTVNYQNLCLSSQAQLSYVDPTGSGGSYTVRARNNNGYTGAYSSAVSCAPLSSPGNIRTDFGYYLSLDPNDPNGLSGWTSTIQSLRGTKYLLGFMLIQPWVMFETSGNATNPSASVWNFSFWDALANVCQANGFLLIPAMDGKTFSGSGGGDAQSYGLPGYFDNLVCQDGSPTGFINTPAGGTVSSIRNYDPVVTNRYNLLMQAYGNRYDQANGNFANVEGFRDATESANSLFNSGQIAQLPAAYNSWTANARKYWPTSMLAISVNFMNTAAQMFQTFEYIRLNNSAVLCGGPDTFSAGMNRGSSMYVPNGNPGGNGQFNSISNIVFNGYIDANGIGVGQSGYTGRDYRNILGWFGEVQTPEECTTGQPEGNPGGQYPLDCYNALMGVTTTSQTGQTVQGGIAYGGNMQPRYLIFSFGTYQPTSWTTAMITSFIEGDNTINTNRPSSYG